MKPSIFIPKTIKVGFRTRSDTYTKQLAYIIYYDEKGKLRKEHSWEGWRDENIEPIDCENIPTSGFVLNKKVGGYDTGWNHRQTYVRVYDSRGFEFEITVPNLLYILENTSSIKGKGLEGEFVYGWDGKDLLLIPTQAPDYVSLSKTNEIIHNKEHIKAKDLKIGATYKTKDQEEFVYMGRFDYYKKEYERVWNGNRNILTHKAVNKGKHYFFYYSSKYGGYMSSMKSIGNKFVEIVSEDCHVNYADLFDELESETGYSPYDSSKDEIIPYTLDEFEKVVNNKETYYLNVYYYNGEQTSSNINKVELRWNEKEECYYSYGWHRHERVIIGDLKAVYEKYKPVYKNEYLKNNKLYRRLP